MISPTDVECVTQELLAARQTGKMVAVPPSARPGFDLDAAYSVEASLKRLREADGHRAVGRKVGYANKAMWRILKLETLVWAHMYDDTVNHSDGRAAGVNLENTRLLKIEPEIVFGLKRTIYAYDGKGIGASDALASTEWIAIGFEIIDCPFPDWKFQASDFVASFGLHAALVIGEKVPVEERDIATLVEELPRFNARISKRGEVAEEGSGRNVLKSPALCLAELGAAIAQRFPDEPLSPGEIVSSGTLTAGHPTERGDLWKVEVEGLSLPLPPLSLQLA